MFLEPFVMVFIIPLLKTKHGDASKIEMYRGITLWLWPLTSRNLAVCVLDPAEMQSVLTLLALKVLL